jgi:hypothetical protein
VRRDFSGFFVRFDVVRSRLPGAPVAANDRQALRFPIRMERTLK